MGAADQEIKKRLLEKLGQGFIHVLLDQQKGTLSFLFPFLTFYSLGRWTDDSF